MDDYFAGIDPGQTGAVAIINQAGDIIAVIDYQGDEDSTAKALILGLSEDVVGGVLSAVIENVHSMPKQGVASSFKFGDNFGQWKGILAMMQWPHELVSTLKWRRKIADRYAMQNYRGLEKAELVDICKHIFQGRADRYLTRKKDHNRAEALLMAEYARLDYLERKRT